MRHRVSGKHLSRTSSHRRAMRRNLAASLIEHGTIRTTVAKAKEVRRFVEKLITTARKGTLHARRQVIALLQDRPMADKDNPEELAEQTVVAKLFDEIAPQYVERPGGYTRIIHLPERRIGDAGKQVLLQLVEASSGAGSAEEAEGTRSARRRRAARRAEAARAAEPEPVEETQAEPAADEGDESPDDQDQQ